MPARVMGDTLLGAALRTKKTGCRTVKLLPGNRVGKMSETRVSPAETPGNTASTPTLVDPATPANEAMSVAISRLCASRVCESTVRESRACVP